MTTALLAVGGICVYATGGAYFCGYYMHRGWLVDEYGDLMPEMAPVAMLWPLVILGTILYVLLLRPAYRFGLKPIYRLGAREPKPLDPDVQEAMRELDKELRA